MAELKPLKITCTSTNCGSNLHCFRAKKKLAGATEQGKCRDCGASLVDWSRVHRRDLTDASNTFASLKLELIRHHFWHIPIAEHAIRYALKKGRVQLGAATKNQISRSIGAEAPYRDGYQTPREDSPRVNAIHYAQHATGSCCRKCLEEWHGISQGRELTEEEVTYLTALAMLYLEERIPELNDVPQRLPKPTQRSAGAQSEMRSEPGHAA